MMIFVMVMIKRSDDGEGVFLYKIGDDDMLSDNDEMFQDKLLTKIRSYSSGKRNM